ncbi:MAG: sigma-70 family RNA polymerase sigma factor [Saprospirales bacterium]|nr:MAG: sigma-70 family RNA polymerase sigma factor [Saprospirales bacterium]
MLEYALKIFNQSKMEQADIKKLVEACIAGEEQAQEQFFYQFGPYVKGVVRKYFKNNSGAEDAFMKAMYKILTRLDSLDQIDSIFGWMRRIAANESLMELRGSKNLMDVEEINQNIPQLETSQKQELDMELIMRMVEELPEGYRNVFCLYEIDGFKHREIAEILGISINTSKSQLIMAKKRLRNSLEALGFKSRGQ